jgi:hypothetical protein
MALARDQAESAQLDNTLFRSTKPRAEPNDQPGTATVSSGMILSDCLVAVEQP